MEDVSGLNGFIVVVFLVPLSQSLWFLCSPYLHLNFIMYPTTEQILFPLNEIISMLGIPHF